MRAPNLLQSCLGAALTLGLLDGVLLRWTGWRDPYTPLALPLASATTAVTALLVAALLAAAGAVARRAPARAGRDPAGLASAAGVFGFAAPFLWVSLRGEEDGARTLALAVAGALVAAVAVERQHRDRDAGPPPRLAALPLAAPLAALALLAASGRFPHNPSPTLAAGALAATALLAAALAAAPALRAPGLPRTPALLAGFAALLVWAGAGVRESAGEGASAARGAPEGRAPRHVVLLVVDTLRADQVDPAVAARPVTPNLDALARASLRFTEARSPSPWTLPAMASLLSGLAPDVHLALRPDTSLAPQVPTLAQAFRDAGYATAAIVQNTVLRPATGLDRGFDSFAFFHHAPPPDCLARRVLRRLGPGRYRPRVGVAAQVDAAIAWSAAHAAQDTFLWLHVFDPHLEYAPPPELVPELVEPPAAERPLRVRDAFHDLRGVRGGYFVPTRAERARIRALYGAEVAFVDRELGRLLEARRALGLAEETLLVFTSDHGEEFWEHGGFEHGHTVFDELLRVPLWIRLPGGRESGAVDEPVSTASVAATLYELAGLPYEPDALSAPPLLVRAAPAAEPVLSVAPRPLHSTGLLYYEDRAAIVFEHLKYVAHAVSGRELLFDLRADPGELRDLAAARPADVARGRELLRAAARDAARLRARHGLGAPAEGALDAASAGALRALGYVR